MSNINTFRITIIVTSHQRSREDAVITTHNTAALELSLAAAVYPIIARLTSSPDMLPTADTEDSSP